MTRHELFRDTLLRGFRNMRTGLGLESLRVILTSCGFTRFEDGDMEDDIQYFMDKGFLVEVFKSHSPGNRIWRITAAGVDDLEKRGL
jgi:hypothetical protein